MKKIKLVHISETMLTGTYTYIKSVCKYVQNDENFETHVIFGNKREGTDIEVIKNNLSDKVELHPVGMEKKISPISDFKSIKQIRKKLKLIKPDIIHLHSSKAGILGRIAAFGLGCHVYYTPHGYSFIRQDISKIKRSTFFYIEKIIQKLLPVTVVACGDSEYLLAQKIDWKRVLLVRNGVDIEKIKDLNRNIYNPIKNKKIIATSGRICIQKNPRLFNQLALKFPDHEFVWIGDGELSNLLTATNIRITGWKTGKEYFEELGKIDIFISLSEWEGLPFTVLEAMSLEKPLVLSNIEGHKITVEDAKNGFLCNSINDYANAIENVLKNPSYYSKNSFNRAKLLFDLNKNLKELKNIYLKNIN